jgi:predicted regulator of Ras-like GTPase activity (Roadblock/LC7/MglB family)
MEKLLKEINAVHGVTGSFICRSDGSVAVSAVPPSLDPTQVETAARIATQTLNALEASGQRVWEADLVYGQARLVLKNLMTGVLVIVCQRNINMPLLNSTANTIAKKIVVDLKPTKPEIIPTKVVAANIGEPGSLLADLEREHKRLIQVATNSEIKLCAIDPIPIWLHCPQARALLTQPDQRRFNFVAPSSQRTWITRFFEHEGYTPNKRFNDMYGDRHLNYFNESLDFNVQVYLDAFTMYHRLECAEILARGETILPLTSLTLVRLQNVEIIDAQLNDLCVLLFEHDLSVGAEKNKIDAAEITHLCADDWGWCKTVTLNLERVIEFATNHWKPADQAPVLERAGRIKQNIDNAPKTLRWQTRARLGGARWYETPLVVMRAKRIDMSMN